MKTPHSCTMYAVCLFKKTVLHHAVISSIILGHWVCFWLIFKSLRTFQTFWVCACFCSDVEPLGCFFASFCPHFTLFCVCVFFVFFGGGSVYLYSSVPLKTLCVCNCFLCLELLSFFLFCLFVGFFPIVWIILGLVCLWIFYLNWWHYCFSNLTESSFFCLTNHVNH